MREIQGTWCGKYMGRDAGNRDVMREIGDDVTRLRVMQGDVTAMLDDDREAEAEVDPRVMRSA